MTEKYLGTYLGVPVLKTEMLPTSVDPAKPLEITLPVLPPAFAGFTYDEELERKIIERLRHLKLRWEKRGNKVWWGADTLTRRLKASKRAIQLAMFCLASRGEILVQTSSLDPTSLTARVP